ncbi:MAG: 5-(carboxyamino)imidazole ribonucleotide synthase [Cyanobacteria bacterium]|nr:5-(carboxyamino)imidazole ribonucleotide synthase [Cyanobacteriota bacterium]
MVLSTDPSLPSQPHGSPPALGIGIVGGGQLALMLAEAAQEQGVALHLQTPGGGDPAVGLATSVLQAQIGDASATLELSRRCSAISFENEWVDLDALAPLAEAGVVFLPSLESLGPLVDKRQQRELLGRLSIPTPRWLPLNALGSAATFQPLAGLEPPSNPAAAANFFDSAVPWQVASPVPASAVAPAEGQPSQGEGGLPLGWSFPVVAKAIRGGYDGKGTLILRSTAELGRLLAQVDPALWILEEFVAFERELALVACRDRAGAVACYPLVETHQHHQVCNWVLAPAQASHGLEAMAHNMAASLLTALDYVGVLSIELFYGPAGLLINELAPRTHNSGHYSIEACSISQFAQQVRIVAGQPLQAPALTAAGALMVNLLGNDNGEAERAAALTTLATLPQATLHWYGKQGSALGRKLGHITVLLQATDPGERSREARQRLEDIRTIWPLPAHDWA